MRVVSRIVVPKVAARPRRNAVTKGVPKMVFTVRVNIFRVVAIQRKRRKLSDTVSASVEEDNASLFRIGINL